MLNRVRVDVSAPDAIARKIAYALEELLTAAQVPHRVERAEVSGGCDLFYSDRPPEGEALWMAASPAAWRFFEQPGARVEQVETARVACGWVRLPDFATGVGYSVLGVRCSEFGPNTQHRIPNTEYPSPALLDLAAGAFFFLSQWEEWQAPQRDRFGRYPLAASVFGRGLWSLTECPVEVYARALRRALEAAPRTAWLSQAGVGGQGPGASQERCVTAPSFTVGLSHDVDSVRRWDARGFARTGRAAARAFLRGRVDAAVRAGDELRAGLRARLSGQDPHQNLEEITALEGEHGARSTFFMFARHTHHWDGTHPVHYQRLLPSLAQAVAPAAEIGLHASTAATRVEALREERERLAQLVGAPVRGVRFHNLRGGGDTLADVAAAGFDYDSTVGFAEEPGFPAGIARPFRPYDRGRDRPLDLVEVPLAVMDTTLLSPRYLGLSAAAGRQRVLTTLEPLRRWGGSAALLWHNDNLPPNTAGGYAALYTELLEWIRAAGGRVATLAEVVDDWKQTRAGLEGMRDEG